MRTLNLITAALLGLTVMPARLMAQEAAVEERPQIKWSNFIHLRGKITTPKKADRPAVYVNKDETFAAIRLVCWTVAESDADGKATKFQPHFVSCVAFGDMVPKLKELHGGDRLIVQGQLDMVDPKLRKSPKSDSHRLIIRHLEVLPAAEKVAEEPEDDTASDPEDKPKRKRTAKPKPEN